jgi:hypothetical protein
LPEFGVFRVSQTIERRFESKPIAICHMRHYVVVMRARGGRRRD